MEALVNGDNACVQAAERDFFETGVPHHLREGLLVRVFADGFGQVAVTVFIAGDQLTEFGQDGKRIQVVQFFQRLGFDSRKFKNERPATRFRTRYISSRAVDFWVTLRRPKAIVTASKCASGNGRVSAFASA